LISAKTLAEPNKIKFTTDIENISTDADAYFFMLSDEANIELSKNFPIKSKILIHSGGSVSQDIFKHLTNNYGVFYPYQTFSKYNDVDFSKVPICLEASNKYTLDCLSDLSFKLGCKSFEINEEKRRNLHLAAVFACNFMNHSVYIGENILQENDIPLELMQPLLEQSFYNILNHSAKNSQTGPAKRMDNTIINKHLQLLDDKEQLKKIYTLLSENISKTYKKNNEE
jgi:predicted short-subunit dehydrogenase-like oxidoreductase (DUF2520 family)